MRSSTWTCGPTAWPARTARTVEPTPTGCRTARRRTLSVPAHSLVTVTIKQYDSGEQHHQPVLRAGARHGGGLDDRRRSVRDAGRPGARRAHVHGPQPRHEPGPAVRVGARCRRSPDDAPTSTTGIPAPHVITFSFITGGAGEYVCQCEFPCGDGTYAKFGGPMSAAGLHGRHLHRDRSRHERRRRAPTRPSATRTVPPDASRGHAARLAPAADLPDPAHLGRADGPADRSSRCSSPRA